MDKLEEAVLSGALTGGAGQGPDPDGREPVRCEHEEGDEAGTLPGDAPGLSNPLGRSRSSQGMTRGRSGNTGPKGVLQDFKASHGKSGAILGGGLSEPNHHSSSLESRLDRLVLRPGGALPLAMKSQRQQQQQVKITSGSGSDESEGEKEVKEARRRERMAEMQRKTGGRASPGVRTDSRGRRLFGYLREVGLENFVQAIDAEKDDRECAVVIHLFDPALESCHMLNVHLATIARLHPTTKFLRGIAFHLDFFTNPSAPHSLPTLTPSPSHTSFSSIETGDPFGDARMNSDGTMTGGQDPFSDGRRRARATDSDVLPTIVFYRGGEQVGSIIAVERELPEGELQPGEEGCRQVEKLLADHGLISQSGSLTNAQGRIMGYPNSNVSLDFL